MVSSALWECLCDVIGTDPGGIVGQYPFACVRPHRSSPLDVVGVDVARPVGDNWAAPDLAANRLTLPAVLLAPRVAAPAPVSFVCAASGVTLVTLPRAPCMRHGSKSCNEQHEKVELHHHWSLHTTFLMSGPYFCSFSHFKSALLEPVGRPIQAQRDPACSVGTRGNVRSGTIEQSQREEMSLLAVPGCISGLRVAAGRAGVLMLQRDAMACIRMHDCRTRTAASATQMQGRPDACATGQKRMQELQRFPELYATEQNRPGCSHSLATTASDRWQR